VAKVLSLPKRSKERRRQWQNLTNKGDYSHNYKVLEHDDGIVIPKYRKKEAEIDNYVPCQHCLGLYLKKDLWKHVKSHDVKDADNNLPRAHRRQPQIMGKLLLPSKHSKPLTSLIECMQDDKITHAASQDSLVTAFGERLMDQYGDKQHLWAMVSQRLRELGRLLLVAKQSFVKKDLKGLLHPKEFDFVVQCVRDVAGYNPDDHSYQIPTLAMRLGGSLKKCANILLSEAIKSEDEELQRIGKQYLILHDAEFSKVSAKAKKVLDKQKFNAPKTVPLCEDVSTLHSYLIAQASAYLTLPQTETNYSCMVQVCLSLIILFNRKRSGEAERLKMEEYKRGLLSGTPDDEVLETLTNFERSLVNKFSRIETEGKRGRKVAIIVTDTCREYIEYCLQARTLLNIKSDYLFAKPFPSMYPYRGCDAIRKHAIESGAKHPSHLTSTKLRKHLATMSQIMQLSEGSQDMLADFMGHSIRVHREFYRLPLDVLHKAKIAKVLLAINSGSVQGMKGKSLEEIEVDDQGMDNYANKLHEQLVYV